MSKIKTLTEVLKEVRELREQGKTIALITGCFDIIHIGHIELFQFAKKNADLVVVGLDNDENIRLSKGEGRPIHNYAQRSKVLEEFMSIDYIFKIDPVFKFDNSKVDQILENIYASIAPDFIITRTTSDKYWKNKEKRAKKMGMRFLSLSSHKVSSSSQIINKLQTE